MEKTIFEQMGGIYHEENGHLIPNLILPPEEEKHIGTWGQRHLRYIKKYKRLFYVNLLTSGYLNSYLSHIDRQADKMFSRLVKQMADREDVTEQLKAENQLGWVQRMNNIRSR